MVMERTFNRWKSHESDTKQFVHCHSFIFKTKNSYHSQSMTYYYRTGFQNIIASSAGSVEVV